MTLGTKAIVVGAVANLFLSLIKFIGGVFGNSIALVADAFHSLSDLITDGIDYFSHGVGQKYLLIKITHMVMGAPKP